MPASDQSPAAYNAAVAKIDEIRDRCTEVMDLSIKELSKEQAPEHRRELAKATLEESRMLYLIATEELRELDSARRDARLEKIARATARATWAAALAAFAATAASFVQAFR